MFVVEADEVETKGAWGRGSDTDEIWSAFFNAVEVWVGAIYLILMEGPEKNLKVVHERYIHLRLNLQRCMKIKSLSKDLENEMAPISWWDWCEIHHLASRLRQWHELDSTPLLVGKCS